VLAGGAVENHVTDDWTTTARVKTALIAEAGMSGFDIHVSTADNVVTLSGTVDRQALRKKAERTARAVGGVRDVKSNLVAGRAIAAGATSPAAGGGEPRVIQRERTARATTD
jgi:osmotically-inducible protein OsmY